MLQKLQHETRRMDLLSVDISDVQAFFLVADTGSFVRAAERLNTSKSKVSRQVSRLEDMLQARLLTRTPKGAQLTDAGTLYYARAKSALNELEAAGEEVAASVSDIAGPIRITGPVSFGMTHLSGALVEFALRHPRVDFDISFTDKRVDVVREGFDLAVRIGVLEDSTLIARKLGRVHGVTIASPDYLARKGRPLQPEDLATHDGIYYANTNAAGMWRYYARTAGKKDRERSVKVPVRLRADNGEMLLKAAIAGMGIARMPTFIAAPAIQSGAVEPILADYESGHTDMHAVMPPARATTARVRALVDFLALKYRADIL